MPSTKNKQPLSILIVDDDISLTVYMRNALLLDKHRVFLAVNEHGAQEVLKHETIDILLCDYILPGLDGLQIINIVKQQPNAPYCVLITGYTGQLKSKHPVVESADMVVSKPILRDTLKSIIHMYHLTDRK